MTYQHEFVMKLNPEYEKHLEFTVCAIVQPNRWVSEHVRLKKPHAQTTQLRSGSEFEASRGRCVGPFPSLNARSHLHTENPGSAAIHVPENAKPTDDTPSSPLPQLPPEKNVPFEAVTGLDTQLTALHGRAPTAHRVSPLLRPQRPARLSEFQASRNQSQRQSGGPAAAAYTGITMGGSGRGRASVVQ